MSGFIDGPLDPQPVAMTLLVEGVTERPEAFQKVADFQRDLERWLAESDYPFAVTYSEIAFGDPPGDGG